MKKIISISNYRNIEINMYQEFTSLRLKDEDKKMSIDLDRQHLVNLRNSINELLKKSESWEE